MRFLLPALLFALLAPARAEDDANDKDKAAEAKPKEIALAVIVHPKNPVTKISFGELRTFLKMERQFWPNRKRCEIYLPPQKTASYGILLDKVYKMSHKKLQKYWVRKLFSGEIPSKPLYAPNSDAAGKEVRKSEGALSIVPASEVPEGVRVLLIDGKEPGQEGYPLVGTPEVKQ